MRTVLAICALLSVSLVFAQDCSSPQSTRAAFGGYLQCIKEALDADYGSFETEVREHNRRAASSCFSPTISEANAKDRCVLAPSDLESKAWDRNGPLRDCSICRTFASGAIKAILSTPAEDQKCIRTEISKAIAREADFCIKKKIADFPGVPDIPDLEEGSFNFKENVINSISDYILIHSRLAFCGERKPARAQSAPASRTLSVATSESTAEFLRAAIPPSPLPARLRSPRVARPPASASTRLARNLSSAFPESPTPSKRP
ncbi:hypothetical protein L596_027594 [Steinernema carpocapsae]|uniref:Saposin B-type domain-containing protein n=1 Tax=Steinernema carpocapsae TaxID=34508 RepID=A0A4U5LVY0_STECR|nr:hypothetical protein L596_027594 [Steinernema carpocapsae]